MMAPTIRVDDQVYKWLQSQAKPFEDTPNSVLRRIADLGDDSLDPSIKVKRHIATKAYKKSDKTPQHAFRQPILELLKQNGGQLQRATALRQLEKMLEDTLTVHDKSDISSGTIRWEKSAEWEVRTMREEGILKPVSAAPRGIWAIA